MVFSHKILVKFMCLKYGDILLMCRELVQVTLTILVHQPSTHNNKEFMQLFLHFVSLTIRGFSTRLRVTNNNVSKLNVEKQLKKREKADGKKQNDVLKLSKLCTDTTSKYMLSPQQLKPLSWVEIQQITHITSVFIIWLRHFETSIKEIFSDKINVIVTAINELFALAIQTELRSFWCNKQLDSHNCATNIVAKVLSLKNYFIWVCCCFFICVVLCICFFFHLLFFIICSLSVFFFR